MFLEIIQYLNARDSDSLERINKGICGLLTRAFYKVVNYAPSQDSKRPDNFLQLMEERVSPYLQKKSFPFWELHSKLKMPIRMAPVI